METKKFWSIFTSRFGKSVIHPQYFIHTSLFDFEETIFDYLRKNPNSRVLDIGPGEGKFGVKVQNYVKSYASMDHPEVTKIYNKLLPVTIYARIEDKKSLPKKKFDVIVCTQVLEYISDYNAAIENMRTLLAPKGALFLSVPFLFPVHDIPYDKIRLSSYALKETLKQNGFKIKKLVVTGTAFTTVVLIFNTALFKKIAYLIKHGGKAKIVYLGILPLVLMLTTALNILALTFNILLPKTKESSYQFLTCIQGVRI